MKPKEIKQRLKELGYEDHKYYEIQDFLYANKTPMKAITKIEYYDEWNCQIELYNDVWLEA